MSTIDLDIGQLPFSSNLRYSEYIDCLKAAVEVVVTYLSTEPPSTEIAFRMSDGQVHDDCLFYFDGNLFDLDPNETQSYLPEPGGTAIPDAPSGPPVVSVTGFTFAERDDDGTLIEKIRVSGLDPVSPAELISILTDTLTGYERFIALLDDDTTVTGSQFRDEIEVGAGNDLVRAGKGDDVVLKWRPGDLDYHGGSGVDTLDFSGAYSLVNGTTPVETLIVNLARGTGRNPFGGALQLDSVEAVATLENVADRVIGSARAETVLGSFSDGDVLSMGGGNDRIFGALVEGGPGLTVDGGGGTDVVNINTIYVASVLNLGDAARNTGVFAGCSFENVEEFDLAADFNRSGNLLDLIGTGGNDVVRFVAVPLFAGGVVGTAVMRLGAGDDQAHGGNGADSLYGGDGEDRLSGNGPAEVLDGDDLLSGGAGRDTIDGGIGNDQLLGGTDRDRIIGGTGDDRLSGGLGRDRFVFADGFGRDRVSDFDLGVDLLDFRGHSGVDRLADLLISQTSAGAQIEDSDGNRIVLAGIASGDLDAGDFLF